MSSPSSRQPSRRSSRIAKLLVLAIVSSVVAIVLGPRVISGELPTDDSFLGTPARLVVRADRDYEIIDENTTALLREQAAQQSRSVWDLDVGRTRADVQLLQKNLVRLQLALVNTKSPDGFEGRAEKNSDKNNDKNDKTDKSVTSEKNDKTSQREKIEKTDKIEKNNDVKRENRKEISKKDILSAAESERALLAGELALVGVEAPNADAWQALVMAIWQDPLVIDTISGKVAAVLSDPIVEDRDLLERDALRGILVRPVDGAAETGITNKNEKIINNVSDIDDVSRAKQRLVRDLSKALRADPLLLAEDNSFAIAGFVAGMVRTTLTYNAAESEWRKRQASSSVLPELVRVHRGEVILRRSETINARHLLMLRAIEEQQGGQMRLRAALATGAFALLWFAIAYRFGVKKLAPEPWRIADLSFVSVLLIALLLILLGADRFAAYGVVGGWFSWLSASLTMALSPLAILSLVPIASGAMLVATVLSFEAALLFAIIISVLGGLLIEPGLSWTATALAASLVGAGLSWRAASWRAFVLAGTGAGLAGSICVAAVESFRGTLVEEQLWMASFAWLISGILSGFVVRIAVPAVELLLGYTSALRLTALTNLNEPLLRDLVVNSPSVWRHSMSVAELAEAAAASIGADLLLTKAIAYYHGAVTEQNLQDGRLPMLVVDAITAFRSGAPHQKEAAVVFIADALQNAQKTPILASYTYKNMGSQHTSHQNTSSPNASSPNASSPNTASQPIADGAGHDTHAHEIAAASAQPPPAYVDAQATVEQTLTTLWMSGALRNMQLKFDEVEHIKIALVQALQKRWSSEQIEISQATPKMEIENVIELRGRTERGAEHGIQHRR